MTKKPDLNNLHILHCNAFESLLICIAQICRRSFARFAEATIERQIDNDVVHDSKGVRDGLLITGNCETTLIFKEDVGMSGNVH